MPEDDKSQFHNYFSNLMGFFKWFFKFNIQEILFLKFNGFFKHFFLRLKFKKYFELIVYLVVLNTWGTNIFFLPAKQNYNNANLSKIRSLT